MSSSQNFLDPNAYSHLQISAQHPPSTPSMPSQPSISAAGRTRQASQRTQYNVANGASEAAQHDIQRFEDPSALNPGDKGDSEYDGLGKKKKRKGNQGTGKSKSTKAAQSVAQHTPVATQPPLVSPPTLPNPGPALSAPGITATPSFYRPLQPPQHHFTSTSTALSQTTPSVVPTYPPSWPAFHVQPQLGGSVPIGLAVPSSPAVPMGIWSDSSSPHGQSLHATFQHSSTPARNLSNFAREPIQHVPSPSPSGGHHYAPFVESEEDEDDGEDDNFTPFCPTVQVPSTSEEPTTPGLPGQTSNHPLGEVTNTTSNRAEPDLTNSSADNDDVLETLRNKTKRRRQPLSRLASALGTAASDPATVEKIDADPTNLNAYNDQERPFLHLVRVVYGAMLVTREAMPNPGTARNFQVEAYQEAGKLLKTGIPSTLPAHPSNLVLRLIAKHGSASRGRLKTAALNAVVTEYAIRDGRAEPAAIATRVAQLLERKNFTFREVTSEGCAGIFRHPAIASVLVNTLFRDRESEGVLVKHMYLPLIPEAAIFMACMAIEHALEMWSTGIKINKDFSNDYTRRLLWNRHKTTWYDYIQRKGDQGEQYARETRELITAQIRCVLDGLSPPSAPGAAVSEEGDSFFDENDAD